MAQIPGATAIPLQPAQADRPMATYQPGIAQQAAEQLGAASARFGQTVEGVGGQIGDAQDRIASAHAQQAFLDAKLQADQDALNDQDYTTLPQRYQARVKQALNEAASSIHSAALRSEFMASMGYMVNRSADAVIRESRGKAIQADRDWLNNYVGGSIDGAMKAPDPATQDLFLQGAHDAIDGMAQKGSITAAEAKQLRQQTVSGFAERSAKMLVDVDPRTAWHVLLPAGEESAPGLQSRYEPGSVVIPNRSRLSLANNNPGNLRFAGQAGAVEGEGGYAKFPTAEDGLSALERQVALDTGRGHTLGSFIEKFAPDEENDTDLYKAQASKALGVSVDTPLSQIPQDRLVSFLAKKESGTAVPAAGETGATPSSGAASVGLQEPRWLQYLPLDKRIQLAREAKDKADAITRQQIALSDKADRDADRLQSQTQKANFGSLFADALMGKDIDPTKLSDMVRHQQITPEQAKAVNAQLVSAGRGTDDIPTLLDLQRRADKGEDISEDVYKAIDSGDLTGKTAAHLLHTTDTRSKQDASQIERAAFSTLRTIAGGDAVEKGMLNLDNSAHVAQMQLWSQAQQEWNQRVLVKKEDPMTVLADMAPRYSHPVQKPEALPAPRFGGRPQSSKDLGGLAQATQQAFDAGQMTQDQFDQERRLLLQYKSIFDDDDRRAAAAKAVPKASGKPLAPSDQ